MMGREHLANIALIPGIEVVSICEPDEGSRAKAAPKAPGAAFEDLETLLARDDLDALVVASPNQTHVGLLERIAQGRPRPVLVEKPLLTDLIDRSRVAALQDYPAPIWVAMEYRYMPPMAALIAAAQQATGGVKMLTIREHRFPFLDKVGAWNRFNRNSGGTLVEKCCHFFDLMRLILGDEAVRVMASAGQAVNHKDERHDGRVPDIWDSGYVIVDFARGGRAMLELCMFAEGAKFQEHVSAMGPAGKIECLIPGPRRFWPAHLGPFPEPQVIESPRHPAGQRLRLVPVDPAVQAAGDHQGSTYYQHQRFRRVVLGEAGVEVTLTDGLRAVEIGLAAQRSAMTGQAVALDVAGATFDVADGAGGARRAGAS